MAEIFTAAVVQAAPVPFERILDKLRDLAADAARLGARLVVFPEAFVSAYPKGLDFGARVGTRTREGREDFRRYFDSALDVPGTAVDFLSRVARENRIYLVAGVIEREIGTPYCTVLFSPPTAAISASTASSCPRRWSAWCGASATDRRCPSSTRRWGASAP